MAEDYEIFTTIDDTEIEDMVTESLEETLSETLASGDERKIFANAITALLCTVFNYLNEKAKMRLLKFASAEVLDYLGERVNCTRLEAEKATCTMRYSLASALSINVSVPSGSTVTPDGVLIFETTETGVIQAGSTYVDIPAQAQEGGSVYNDYAAGTINTQVSVVSYISSVENITVTSGGDDGEPYPLSDDHPDGDDGTGDDNYRERIKKAPAGFSVAGPEEAYEYYTLSADASIEDVLVNSEQEAGRIDITVTTTGGGIPDDDVLANVLSACNDKSVRPMNDYVNVYAPVVTEYDIEVVYYVTEDDESDAVSAIEDEGGAIDTFIEWQCAKISRDINPDKLKALLVSAGAKRADITSPVYTVLGTTSSSVTSYTVEDADGNIRYVEAEGSEGDTVEEGTLVYETVRRTDDGAEAAADEYTYTGESAESPKGVGELAQFSGNLTISHVVEDE